MADISDLIIKMRADAADVETGFNRASASLDQFINKLKTPQVMKVSVITSFATVGGATAASKVGQMLYDQADAAEQATTAVEKYSRTISSEMAGAYDSISASTEKSTTNISNMTQAIFRDSANATAAYSDYMSDLIERNAGSWYDFSEKVGTAVGWVTKSILTVAATMAWLLESSTIIFDDLWNSWLDLWEKMKAPVTRLYDWAVDKLGWLLDAVKWIVNAVSSSTSTGASILSPEAQNRLKTSLDSLKKGVSDIWAAQSRTPHAKTQTATGAKGKTDKWIDNYDEIIAKMYKEEVKFQDGIMAGLKVIRDEKLAVIDADQKMLDIERLMGMSEQDYLEKTLINLEDKVQAQRDLIASKLEYGNVIDAKEFDELDRQEKLLAIQRRRVEVEKILRTDAMAGTMKALSDLENEYGNTGKLMENYTIGVFKTMEVAFADFCDTGQFKFKDFVRSALINLNTLLFKIAVLEPMAKNLRAALGAGGGEGGGFNLGSMAMSLAGKLFGFGAGDDLAPMSNGAFGPGSSIQEFDLTNARGNVFAGGRLLAFARGGIFHQPTVFPMAGGMGLMGEAGPEAVVPLKRTASGDLGIQGGAGGNVINVNISAVDGASFYELCRRNPAAITDPIERALQGNQKIRHTIRRTTR